MLTHWRYVFVALTHRYVSQLPAIAEAAHDKFKYGMPLGTRLGYFWVTWKRTVLHAIRYKSLSDAIKQTIARNTMAGILFTHDILLGMQLWWKFHFAVIQVSLRWSLQNLTHATAAVLSWPVLFFSDTVSGMKMLFTSNLNNDGNFISKIATTLELTFWLMTWWSNWISYCLRKISCWGFNLNWRKHLSI